MPYLHYGANVGGKQFRGSWKPFGYNQVQPTSAYKAPNPMWGYAGAAIGFGTTVARNWGTIQAVGRAARAGFGAALGGAAGGPSGAIAGAAGGLI